MATQTIKSHKKKIPGSKSKTMPPGATRSPTSKRSYSYKIIDSPRGARMLLMRSEIGFSRDLFARMLPVSTRTLATIEAGNTPNEAVKRKLTELRRIISALSEIIRPETIGEWLKTPNDAFDGLKPLEVIERGEVDRLWQMIFHLKSGVAF